MTSAKDIRLPLRSVVFWVHLACGLTAGLVILMMSVTGVLLTYQKQMNQWADREFWGEPAVAGTMAPLSSFVASATEHDAEASVSSLVIHGGEDGPVAASIGGGRILYMDPSTAEVLGQNNTGVRSFLSATMRWHRWFAATGESRATFRAITGWSNLVFLFLVVSGLYLWFPRRWTAQHLRPILKLNPAARGKARDFNWHHVFGFWTSIPLALVVASASVISFPWASDLAYRVVGDTPPQRNAVRSAPAANPTARALLGSPVWVERTGTEEPPVPFDPSDLDPILEPAMTRLDEWRAITVRIPSEAGTPVEVRVEQGWGGEPQKRHTLRYEAGTGREVAYETFADQSRGRRFRTFLRFAHTGEYFGVFGQTVAGLASLAGILLVWSGFALAWRRLVTPLLKRGAAPA